MKISLDWLSEFVRLPSDRQTLETRLAMLGLGVASSVAAGADRVLDLEVTTNRPDCLGHLGVAREVAAAFGETLSAPRGSVPETNPAAGNRVSIEIEDQAGCARYCGRVLENVRVQPSPEWLVRRLEAVNTRPINNVADVTNYVLMELGHPLHAFDLDRLQGRKIIVRRARPAEKLLTLDGVDRTLTPEDLVIADRERAVALAGVMGGQDSAISNETRAVLLESAWFSPAGIRRTAKRHGLHTEASHRFERGGDIEMAPRAIDRAAALIAELGGGQVLRGVVDVYPEPRERTAIVLRSSEIRRILGAGISGDYVSHGLRALGFLVEPEGDGFWRVTPPSFRLDVEREIDLIEEVARSYGYDRLPSRLRAVPPPIERDTIRENARALTAALTGLGYREIIAPSMVDPEENARFTSQEPVRLLNPLTENASAMRSTPVPGMLRALGWNLDRGQPNLRLFELGKVYTTSVRTEDGLPSERRVLTLGATGQRYPPSIHERAQFLDIFDLKGDVQALLDLFDFPGLAYVGSACFYHDKGFSASFMIGGQELARFGQLSLEIAREYKLRQPVYVAEVNLERLLRSPQRNRTFQPFSKFPAVERDLSLVVPESLSYEKIQEAISALSIENLQGSKAADRFQGGALPAGHYGLLLRIILQSSERTLTTEEVDRAIRRILDALEALGVHLRKA